MVVHAIERAPSVDADLKPLRKKIRKLDDDLAKFLREDLSLYPRRQSRGRNPIPGIPGVWKTRMGIPSANIGESGGMRLIYWPMVTPPLIYLLRAYYKRQTADLPRKVLLAAKERARPLLEAELKARGFPPEIIEQILS